MTSTDTTTVRPAPIGPASTGPAPLDGHDRVPPGRRPLDLAAATTLIATAALRDSPPGPVGIELEGHVHHTADPYAPLDFSTLATLAAALSPLPSGALVTLEPGGQLEVSSAVHPDVASAVAATRADAALVGARLAELDLSWTLRGADPWRPPHRINPSPRYAGMEAWFDRCADGGVSGRTMMCATAALQVNLEAGTPGQWAARVRRAARLGPLLTALTGSSRWLAGCDTGLHSARQRAWSTMDARVGGPLLAGADPVADWTSRVLAAPVLHLAGSAGLRPTDRCRSFADWVCDPADWPPPTADDLHRHLTTQFPSVRLRGFLEFRCLDALPEPWWPAVVTALVTWMDDERAHAEIDAALGPVADRWEPAYAHGLADPALQQAAVRCLHAAVGLVGESGGPGGAGGPDPTVRATLVELLTLARTGRSPGDLLPPPAGAGRSTP